jgi:hypothetical protein
MNIMLPTSDKFVEEVAKAIGRTRMRREAVEMLELAGIAINETDELTERFDAEFDYLWDGNNDDAAWCQATYKEAAIAVINKINLLLLTMPG